MQKDSRHTKYFYDHSGIKLEINYRKISENVQLFEN